MVETVVAKAIKLPKEVRENLEKLAPMIEEADAMMKLLDRLGMDTSGIKTQVEWAKNAKKIMLEEMG